MEITNDYIDDFVNQITEPRKTDILKLVNVGKDITKKNPKIWGTIIGFGKLHYTYKTGRQGDMPEFGIANRKQAITLYMSYDINQFEELQSLGKYKSGQGCLYIKKLDDIDLKVLKKLIIKAIKELKNSGMIEVIE
jgi:hypothetical protein